MHKSCLDVAFIFRFDTCFSYRKGKVGFDLTTGLESLVLVPLPLIPLAATWKSVTFTSKQAAVENQLVRL